MSVAQCVRTGAAVLGVLLMAETVHAADPYYYGGYKDQPPPPPQNLPALFWQGFYAGANLGGLWSRVDAADNVVFVMPTMVVQPTQSVNLSGLLGGVQAGYNFTSGNFLYGIEGDIGWMDNSASRTFLPAPAHSVVVSSKAGLYADITARGGLTYGDALFYAKGGFALLAGDVTVSVPTDGISQSSGTLTGWTIGAGLEYLINPRWSVKAEYLYVALSNNTCCFTSTAGQFDDRVAIHTVKLGFNFYTHSQVAPLN